MSTTHCIRSIRNSINSYCSRFYEDNRHIYFNISNLGRVRS